ncbi:MAG: ribonuclease P protein component [Candidatus Magasanikbacteria bacterium]|nr:ribonuclease P protein component [Candidatus Magasanikbacteria bacterium]
MLKPDNRLAKVRDFNLLMKHGRWVNGQFLDMRVLELAKIQNYFPKKVKSRTVSGAGEDTDKFKEQLRIAITVGLKVSKSVVKRNRARRQISEVLRLIIKDGRLKGGHYLLFVAKKDILTKNYSEISTEVKLLLNKGKLFLSE